MVTALSDLATKKRRVSPDVFMRCIALLIQKQRKSYILHNREIITFKDKELFRQELVQIVERSHVELNQVSSKTCQTCLHHFSHLYESDMSVSFGFQLFILLGSMLVFWLIF